MKLVASTRVCLRMFSHAAFASTRRAVSLGARMEQLDLDRAGPDSDCPFACDDDPSGPCVSWGDISVSDIAVPASLLPLARGPPSAEQARFRTDAHSTLLSLFAPSAAPGTVRTKLSSKR